jgi:hypothetical protein
MTQQRLRVSLLGRLNLQASFCSVVEHMNADLRTLGR